MTITKIKMKTENRKTDFNQNYNRPVSIIL